MSDTILTDDNGNSIGYWPVVLESGEESAPIILRVVVGTAAGILKASINADAALLIRLTGSGDPYTPLSDGIDLAPYVGTTRRYDLIARASAVVGHAHAMIFVAVTTSGPAAWAA